jgi:hypothetical protein
MLQNCPALLLSRIPSPPGTREAPRETAASAKAPPLLASACGVSKPTIQRRVRIVTPAMEVGLADHVWSIEEIVTLLDRQREVAA